jgi:hypothetical protein
MHHKVNSIIFSNGWISLTSDGHYLSRKGNPQKSLNIVRKEGEESAKLEILVRTKVTAEERI